MWSSFQPNTSEHKICMHDMLVEVEDFMTENDHELTTKAFAFVDTIDDLESERKQTGYWD